VRSFTPQNLIFAVVSSFIVLKFARKHIFKKHLTKQAFCRFKIHLRDEIAELNALVDTGNSLIDPISQNPVIIAEFDKIKHLLPQPVAALFDDNSQDDLAAVAAGFARGGLNTRIRMIPYSAIGKSGVILGFRPDKIEVSDKETKDVIIGICDFALSNDGEYHALMNPLLCD
jgi:stage II sporulation protein GA (sporulation sigma-E factor processing peptidase)